MGTPRTWQGLGLFKVSAAADDLLTLRL